MKMSSATADIVWGSIRSPASIPKKICRPIQRIHSAAEQLRGLFGSTKPILLVHSIEIPRDPSPAALEEGEPDL